jgi:hypothetical protein
MHLYIVMHNLLLCMLDIIRGRGRLFLKIETTVTQNSKEIVLGGCS